MNTWQQLLRDHDPAAAPNEARLDVHEVEAIRRTAIAAAREPRPAPLRWKQPLAMAALIVVMIGTGVVAGRRAALRGTPTSPTATIPIESPQQQQQLQFSTPGGTRIIWVFNSEFEMRETIP
jgi:hypothetical protein